MPVNPIRPSSSMPPLPLVIPAEAESSDPTQRLSTDSRGYIRVEGEASNSGIVASQASLSFEGKTVSVPVASGTTPYQTFQALEKAMPEGYRLRLVHQAGKDVLLEVISTTRSGPPSRPEPQRPSQPSRPDSFQPVPTNPSRPGPWMPPMPQKVEAKVWSGDHAQRVTHDSTGQIRIGGLADGTSEDPRLNLYFDGIDVNVRLTAGMTPYQTYEAIAASMPEGYKANLVFQAPHSHSDVLIELKKQSPSRAAGSDWLP